jgi:integrase
MAKLYMELRKQFDSYTTYFKEQYLEKKRSFSPNTVDNIHVSVRAFFIWYKNETLGMDKEDFIVYHYPSTHHEAAGEPDYTAEEICCKPRREIEDIIFGEDKYGLIDAEACIGYEEENKNREPVLGYFRDKKRAEPKIDYVKVTEEDVKSITRIHIARFIDYLRDRKELYNGETGVKRSTARKYVNSLKHFVKFFSHTDYCPLIDDIDFEEGAIKDSMKDFKNQPAENRDLGGKTLSPNQVEKLIDSRSDAKERAIILTLVKTGMRREELTNIKMKHLHLDENWIFLKHRKGGKNGTVIFDEECKRYLGIYVKSKYSTDPEDYLFTDEGEKYTPAKITRKYQAWAKQAGIKEDNFRGPHDLRHTFASHQRKEVRGTKSGVYIFRRVQMSHKDNRDTGERYDFDFNDSDKKPIEERFEDYRKAVPKYLSY